MKYFSACVCGVSHIMSAPIFHAFTSWLVRCVDVYAAGSAYVKNIFLALASRDSAVLVRKTVCAWSVMRDRTTGAARREPGDAAVRLDAGRSFLETKTSS